MVLRGGAAQRCLRRAVSMSRRVALISSVPRKTTPHSQDLVRISAALVCPAGGSAASLGVAGGSAGYLDTVRHGAGFLDLAGDSVTLLSTLKVSAGFQGSALFSAIQRRTLRF